MQSPGEKVPLKTISFYAIGNLGSVLLNGFVMAAGYRFYTDIFYLSWVPLIMTHVFYLIWNAINDPIFGYMSDRTKSVKHGRRGVWLKASSILYGPVFLLFWFPVAINQITLGISLLIFFLIFDTVYTIYGVNQCSILPELTTDATERTRVMVFFTVPVAFGMILNFILPTLFFSTIQFPSREILLFFFWLTIILVGIGGGACTILFSFTHKERPEFQHEDPLPLLKSIKETLKNKQFVLILIYNFAFYMLVNILPTTLSYLIEYIIRVDLIFIISVIIFIAPLAIILIRYFSRLGLRKAAIIASGSCFVGLVLIFFAQDQILSALAVALAGFGLVVYALTINPLIADAIDLDATKTGSRREGAYFGVNALVTKPGISLGQILIAFITQGVFGYVGGIGITQTPLAIFGLRVASSVIWLPFLICALIAMYLYNIGKDPDEYKKFKEEVDKLNAEKRRLHC